MAIGIVKFFKVDKGYGFIKPEDGSDDVFVHIRDVAGHQELHEGMRVAYELSKDAKTGKMRGVQVRML